ncbi:MAG: radical SAM protein, partial [Paracoccaceae bacterium]
MAKAAPQFVTHGCRLNAYESHAMQTLAANSADSDLVVINTCAVTSEAVRKARQEVRKQRAANPGARLVVTGCAAQTEPATFAQMAEVDMVIGNHEKMLPETWADAGGAGAGLHQKTRVGDIMSVKRAITPLIDGFGSRARAYVQVQNGCDHRCTFCIIPFGRGNSRSVPAMTVIEQIRRLVGRGYNEVVLSGVDLTSWGADLADAGRLGDLVNSVLTQVPDLPRLRITSIDSNEADAGLMRAIANQPRLMPHLHLSL